MKTAKKPQTRFCSISNGAGQVGVPIEALRYAKREGAPGFRSNGGFYWPEVQAWICSEWIEGWGFLPADPVEWLITSSNHDVRRAVGALRFHGNDRNARKWVESIANALKILLAHCTGEPSPTVVEIAGKLARLDWSESPAEMMGWNDPGAWSDADT